MDITLENWLGSRHDVGYLAAEEWRQRWRFMGWGVETTLETLQLGTRQDVGDLVAG